MGKIYVLDTNVLIQAPYAPACFEENEVILPLVVLEELDNLKKDEGERGVNVRRAIRFLEQTPEGRLVFKSGGGITFQSDVKSEYEEMKRKVYVPIY